MSMTWPPIMPGGSGVREGRLLCLRRWRDGEARTSRRMATTVAAGACRLGDGLKGQSLEGVAGEDGDGFAEDDVAGGLAAAEVVVVEGGQVVVDEE